MQIRNDIKLDASDVLIVPKRSTIESRKEVDITRTFKFKYSGKTWTGIPICASNMVGIGTLEMSQEFTKKKMLTFLIRKEETNSTLAEFKKINKNVVITSGISEEDINYLGQTIIHYPIEFLCLDAANGYTEKFVRQLEKIRKLFPETTLIAGNVATPEMTEELILAGADIVKVGIGSGSACITRKVTGVGYPQLSAIIECADAAHQFGGRIISDGGVVEIGDFMKFFGAGADFVMCGGLFAGHGTYHEDTKSKIKFYGNSSSIVNKEKGKDYATSEGRIVEIDYKGHISPFLDEIIGGIKSGMSYIGAVKLREVPKRTTFVRVNSTHNRIFEENTIGR